jgi:hypothetical protein
VKGPQQNRAPMPNPTAHLVLSPTTLGPGTTGG